MSRDEPPILFSLAKPCHGLQAGDGTTAVDNKDWRASFKIIDEGAETVFSLSDSGISRPASLLRASIIRPTALALVWLALLLIAYRLW
jgi:hypothetical protein